MNSLSHYDLRNRSLCCHSLVIEVMDGKKNVYLDRNDGVSGFGITTNEPTLDWHIENVKHYEWKRTLSRQSIAVPGNWYSIYRLS